MRNRNSTYSTKVHQEKQDLGTTINTGLWYNTENGIKVHPEKRDLGTTLKTGLRYISDLRGGYKWAMLSNTKSIKN